MKDCLGNEVSSFVPNNEPKEKGASKEKYWHATLVDVNKQAVRVYNPDGSVAGWNIVPRNKN